MEDFNVDININLNINDKKKFDCFVNEHYEILYYLYNTIFKDYQSILDFNTFLNFSFEKSTHNGRLYKN
jgi:hypothetical protein